ncbi:MAG: hypothetical protein B7Y39_12885 [Bdellovibrio sp. 28-41-41]|nr:MAG: hypothetical protein B7Y39_12885 [Bdellovibrio sp. 28-41-41]
MKKILVINGHPNMDSLCTQLAKNYVNAAADAGLDAKLINSQTQIKWAEHIVFVFPMWWGTVPGMMKRAVMEFSGIIPVTVTQFDTGKAKKPQTIQMFLKKATELGRAGL